MKSLIGKKTVLYAFKNSNPKKEHPGLLFKRQYNFYIASKLYAQVLKAAELRDNKDVISMLAHVHCKW